MPPSVGWEQVRRSQLAEMSKLVPVICLTNLFNGVVLASALHGTVSTARLLAWLGALTAVILAGIQLSKVLRRRANSAPVLIRWPTVCATALGAVWAVPTLYFSVTDTVEQQLSICLVVAGVIGSAALTMFSVPLAMFGFILASGTGLVAMMAETGSMVLITLSIAYAFCVALGGLAAGRALIIRTWTEISLAEKRAVVSLLLREHDEDEEADWLWETDASKRLIQVNARMARATRIEPAQLEGMPLFQLLAGTSWESGRFAAHFRDLLDRMNAREGFTAIELPVKIDGEDRWWRLSATPRWDWIGRFSGFRGVGSDITKHRQSVDQIDRMARFDGLTGLANRLHFNDALRKALSRQFREDRDCALMLIDLDRFKPVNDTLGHPIGDRLLKMVAQRLSGLCQTGDVCGRLGGDEFAIILADSDPLSRVDAVGEAIIAAITQPFSIDDHLVRIGASVGTAIGIKDGRTVETLLRHADLALYRAKEDGRGLHRRFEPAMLVRAEKRRAIETALRSALDEDQLHLVYQPIVGAHDGEVVGFEALLRWSHPQLGEMSPAAFVPIAEEARLLGRIGAWTLRKACAEASTWPHDIRLCLNLSADQLHDPQLAASVFSILASSNLSPSRLELEVSERTLSRDSLISEPALDRLRAIGVRIALDDFGLDNGALAHATSGRFASIKIDPGIVRRASGGEIEGVAVIRAIVSLADTLAITTVAEGVETETEFAAMRNLGCTCVQGFARGEPVSAAAVTALINRRSRRVA